MGGMMQRGQRAAVAVCASEALVAAIGTLSRDTADRLAREQSYLTAYHLNVSMFGRAVADEQAWAWWVQIKEGRWPGDAQHQDWGCR